MNKEKLVKFCLSFLLLGATACSTQEKAPIVVELPARSTVEHNLGAVNKPVPKATPLPGSSEHIQLDEAKMGSPSSANESVFPIEVDNLKRDDLTITAIILKENPSRGNIQLMAAGEFVEYFNRDTTRKGFLPTNIQVSETGMLLELLDDAGSDRLDIEHVLYIVNANPFEMHQTAGLKIKSFGKQNS